MKKTKEELKELHKINDGHYFEVLDRAYTICEMMETLIGEHPLLIVESELKEHYNKMIDIAADFYQLAGSIEYINSTDYIERKEESHLRPIVKDMPDDYEMDN